MQPNKFNIYNYVKFKNKIKLKKKKERKKEELSVRILAAINRHGLADLSRKRKQESESLGEPWGFPKSTRAIAFSAKWKMGQEGSMWQGKCEMGFLFVDWISSRMPMCWYHMSRLWGSWSSKAQHLGHALFSKVQNGATSHRWLFEFKYKLKLIQLKFQFLSYTSLLSHAIKSLVASGYWVGQPNIYGSHPSTCKVLLHSESHSVMSDSLWLHGL